MKMTKLKFARVGLGLLFLVMCCGQLQTSAQNWYPVGQPTIGNFEFPTIGGITYFTYTATVENCHRVASGPVTRSGTNLFQTINKEAWTGPCSLDFPGQSHTETHVSVLGALEPDDYLLRLSSVEEFSPGGTQPFRFITLSVPISETPALQVSVKTNYLNLAVAGIPDVTYNIETSSTLTNWVSVFTNVGGPFVWSKPFAPAEQGQFYRLKVTGK